MQRMVMHLEELVNRIDADLAAHLRHTGIEFLQFAFKWMNCLLLREFRLSCVMRLWDTYLSEGDGGFEDFHVYVCASFLVHFSSELQQMGFDELFQFMQVRERVAVCFGVVFVFLCSRMFDLVWNVALFKPHAHPYLLSLLCHDAEHAHS